MVGNLIKYLASFIIIILFYKCSKNVEIKEIDLTVFEYIKEELEPIDIKNSVIIVKKDSTNSKYIIYRIALYANLLDRNAPIPNRISNYKDFKIAYFTKELKNKASIQEMKKSLNQKLFYKTDSVYFSSNYPEWVLIRNNFNSKELIIKNMWYKPVDSILKKYKDEIDNGG